MTSSSSRTQEQPIRLFRSDFLEFFSHISPTVVALIWTPVFLYLVYAAYAESVGERSLLYIPVGVLLGWFIWTFVEYVLHRFIFHYHPRTERLKRFFFVMHGVHHAQPMCRTRLVMPPAISVPLAVAFYGLYFLVVVVLLGIPHWLNPLFAGAVGGYLVYDLMHYQIHHSNIKAGAFFELRKHHLRHHGVCDFMRFGVSIPLWDHVFGTMPDDDCTPKERFAKAVAEYKQQED